MSFVTKRERVFEPDLLVELPARSEGKIKNFSSCTDTRAWSHHTTDQTEHLMENIKRNTCICRPKYLSTEVIVKTLMTSKNKEIAKLRRKIAQLEEMLASYDCLDLSCAQKCEIAKAHESIKACYQDLNDMSLELDLSGFTEGVDSEAFETGKSGGDMTDRSCCTRSVDSRKQRNEVKFSSVGDSSISSCKCDKATSPKEQSCTELQQIIKEKDAKLKSLQNTLKIMENDSCEPYCVYAHIYTALEKIFCVLSQNQKYRECLCLLAKGQREGCDIKAKIYFKLKILEKFSAKLISPCPPPFQKNCSCYHLQITNNIETSYAVTSSETKRALLAADIMETDDIKEILDEDSETNNEVIETEDDWLALEQYDVSKENLNRLINLQRNYDELIICYESVKYERDLMQSKFDKCEELENELEILRDQLKEFDDIKLNRDEYRTKLDELNAQFIILSEEADSFKMQIKAEAEINLIKTNKIAELRNENIALEKKISDMEAKHEKEKQTLHCKIMEMECKIMCQEQQIKSLTQQIDRLVKENDEKPTHDTPDQKELLKEISVLKSQVNRLKEILYTSGEEKKSIEEKLSNSLGSINDLKTEIGHWKENYESVQNRNENLEKSIKNLEQERDRIMTLNKHLSHENNEKSDAAENLLNVLKNKSLEINRLLDEIENQKRENSLLQKQLAESKNNSNADTVRRCDDVDSVGSDLSIEELLCHDDEGTFDPVKLIQYLTTHNDGENIEKTCRTLTNKIETLQKLSNNLEIDNKHLLEELKKLQDLNESTIHDMNNLQKDKKECHNKLELALKEIKQLEKKLSEFQQLSSKMQKLEYSYDQLLNEKIEKDSHKKCENEEHLENLKEYKSLKDALTYLCQKLINGEMVAQNDVTNLSVEVGNLIKHIEILQIRKQNFCEKYNVSKTELYHLKNKLEVLIAEKGELQNDLEDKINEINKLKHTLEKELDENNSLNDEIQKLKLLVNENLRSNPNKFSHFNNLQNQFIEIPEKTDECEKLKKELFEAKKAYSEMESQKDKFLKRFEEQMCELKQMRIENQSLYNQKKNLIVQNTNLENELEELRNEVMTKACAPQFNCSVIIKETEQMKKEKIQSLKKNHELLKKIDDMENTISDLSEQVMVKGDKIAILENYINSLEDEIIKLQESLGTAVSMGEQICYNSVKNKESTLKLMDANRVKIVRGLKKQIEKLQNDNVTIEKQWFAMKLQFDELEREKDVYISEINNLKNERNIMLVELRKFNFKSISDSMLQPENSSLEEILTSIKRLKEYIEAKDAKNSTLEHTLMKVQTSSQLLLSKADEAKVIIEKEKLKMHNEKEEAIKDKLLMTKELSSLKEKLENQVTMDKQIIKDLEAELLNHKLIIQNINKASGNDMIKYEKEMQYLRNMYKQSVFETKELRETLQIIILEKETNRELLNKNSKLLNQKIDEINYLNEQLSNLRSKQKSDRGAQTETKVSFTNIETQTLVNVCDFCSDMSDNVINNENSNLNTHYKEMETQTDGHIDIVNLSQIVSNITTIPHTNQFQLDDFFRYCVDIKFKNLSKGSLEQYSITSVESINCSNRNKTKKGEEVALFSKHYGIWKDSSKQLKQHMMIPKNFFEEGSILEVKGRVTENNSKTKILAKNDDKPLNELFHLINKKNENTNIENERLLQNELQENTKMTGGDKIENINRKYITESHVKDLSQGETYIIQNNMLENNNRDNCVDFCHHVTYFQTLNNNLITCKDSTLLKNHKLKRNLSCTATNLTTINLDSASNERLSINRACETKQTPMNSCLYSIYSTNNLIVYSDDNFVIDDLQPPMLLNNESSNKNKIITSSFNQGTYTSLQNLSYCDENEIFLKTDSKIQFVMTTDGEEKKCLINNEHSSVNKVSINKNERKVNFNDIEIDKQFGTKTHIVNAINQEFYTHPLGKSNNFDNFDFPNRIDSNLIETFEDNFTKNIEDTNKFKTDKSIEVHMYEKEFSNNGTDISSDSEYIDMFDDTAQTEAYDSFNNNVINKNTKGLLTEVQYGTNVSHTDETIMRPTSPSANEKSKKQDHRMNIDKVPVKNDRSNSNPSTRTLVATKVVAVEIKPSEHSHEDCVCLFNGTSTPALETKHKAEKDNRERVYKTHIARKVLTEDIEELDVDELKFLHSKVCQSWKSKMQSEKALLRRLEVLEAMKHPGQDPKNELQRKVREERRKLLEYRKAVFRATPAEIRMGNREPKNILAETGVLNSNTLGLNFGNREALFNDAESDISHSMNRSYHRPTDDAAPSLKPKANNAYRTAHGRQPNEDKRELRGRRGAVTADRATEDSTRPKRGGVGVNRQHKK